MSSRNLRKVLGDRENTLPPPGDSDGDYEPLYAKGRGGSNFSRYHGLELNSEDEKSADSDDADPDDPGVVEDVQPVNKKKNNKKKRKRNKAKSQAELDEVDKSIQEVNRLLGPVELEDAPSTSSQTPSEPSLMQVEAKHLTVSNELKRWFGPDVIKDEVKKHGRSTQYMTRLLKKVQLVNMDVYLPLLKKDGLSMSINRREGPLTFFTFDHSQQYQRARRSVLAQLLNDGEVSGLSTDAEAGGQVEAMIHNADYLFTLELYNKANELIEQTVAYMHYVSHPSFNLCDINTRLEYRYLENRPFFIAILKYLHLLTNKVCHRTALELAKLLLNLDPSDPLAVILVIDTLALRAREHEWLVGAIDHLMTERSAGYLHNMKYSYALALFHVTKKKGDTTEATKQLESAFFDFPSCLMEILKFANHVPGPRLKEHAYFTSWAKTTTPIHLQELITLYAKMTWGKWREPDVMQWLIATANGFLDKLLQDEELQEQVRVSGCQRATLYEKFPDEVLRHLSIIKPMAALLVDNVMPSVSGVSSTDPKPPGDTVDRYKYLAPRPRPATVHSVLQELGWSLLPNYHNRNEPHHPDID